MKYMAYMALTGAITFDEINAAKVQGCDGELAFCNRSVKRHSAYDNALKD